MRRSAFGLAIILLSVVSVHAMLSTSGKFDEAFMLSSYPEAENGSYGLMSSGNTTSNQENDIPAMLGGYALPRAPSKSISYVYEESVILELDLSLSDEVTEIETILPNHSFRADMNPTAAELNATLASIYKRYLDRSLIPLKDPLWMIAIGSVEYGYSKNMSDIIFSFPVDIEAAAGDPNYLLRYDWREAQRIAGTSAVLRRDGSSIGIFQITRGYGTTIDPTIGEEFGIIGSVSGRRADCWMTLGDGSASGEIIVWKPGVNGDRWSPADCANVVTAVYSYALKGDSWPQELRDKYEQAICLMWAHNRGMSLISNPEYIEKTKALAKEVPEIIEFVRELKPSRFSRTNAIMGKAEEIASRVTGGDRYPVMCLISYLITEERFNGQW